MNSLVKSYPEMEIPHARRIIDTRNFVIHGYDKVDDAVLWGIIINTFQCYKRRLKSFWKRSKIPLMCFFFVTLNSHICYLYHNPMSSYHRK
jgi:uncharacterized protein with HEPN domain